MGAGSESHDADVTAAPNPFAYNAQLAGEIERRWQQRWSDEGTFGSPNPVGPLSAGFEAVKGRRKAFILDMFPYPSGSGLHVGHPLGYIGTDVLARYLRMTGHHVLHTFGYDAFGLPAEQYAIETGQHPSITTQNNIDNMRKQLRRLGLGHDTRREVATADPAFYRWTQWIFLQLFNSWYDESADRARHINELVEELAAGRRPLPGGESWDELSEVERRQVVDGFRLAYISSEMVNWCPGLGTVLANEEVTADGRSDVGNHPVYRRPLRQWMLRITAYAERLLADLDALDWPESIKQLQRNWIGQGNGARIDLAKAGDPGTVLTVFTTRPDTLAGATYVVLAPEHPLVDKLTATSWPEEMPSEWKPGGGASLASTPKEAVDAYRDQAAQVSDRQRTAGAGDKTGVFTGAFVTNPANGEAIPVFIADYILMGYGTGAIMAVPAHDQRDFEFARKFSLEIRAVLEPSADWMAERGLAVGAAASSWPESYAGDGEYLRVATATAGSGFPDLAGLTEQAAITSTIEWLDERGLGGAARFYRLRDWLFSRQRYWGEPFPIVYDSWDLPVALRDDQLPVLLPEMTEFRPAEGSETGEPVPPLARIPGWSEVELDLGFGLQRYRRELNTMPQWAGSCWYYLRYLDPLNDQRFVDPQVERYWMGPPDDGGVDLYVGGVEHAVLHLLYARFWHKVLYDLGQVSTREPFHRLYNQGYILADAFTDSRGLYVPAADVVAGADGRISYHGEPVTRRAGKMGKSLKNGVTPDDIYAQYGADTLRIYEMFMGPLNVDRPWRTTDIVGAYRFLQRLWRCVVDDETGAVTVADVPLGEDTTRLLHTTITSVREDLAGLRFNTAVAELMKLTTHALGLARDDGAVPRELAESLTLMVAPLAPHLAEELWGKLGHAGSLAYETFPEADASLLQASTVEMPVQVNGKVRFVLNVPAQADQAEIEALLVADPHYAQVTSDTAVKRLIIVPGRIISLVVR
jgi:leucyl-tRNA synthetase